MRSCSVYYNEKTNHLFKSGGIYHHRPHWRLRRGIVETSSQNLHAWAFYLCDISPDVRIVYGRYVGGGSQDRR